MTEDRARRAWLGLAGWAGAAALGGRAQAQDPASAAAGAGELSLPGQRDANGPDATAALRQLLERCIDTGMTAVLSGQYLVSGRLTDAGIRPAGQLHIRCVGDVRIRVAPQATPFGVLIACHTAAPNHSTILGGRLTLDLSGRCASGIVLRHAGPEGGTVMWGPLTVRDARNLDVNDVNENQGLLIDGRYQHVDLLATRVSGVDRINTRAGACKGISISGAAGQVTLHQPFVELVRCTGSAADADGISVFGQWPSGGAYAWRMADVQILQPVVRDCQGRSIKIQASETLVDRPRIYRQQVATFAVADIDFQVGNGLLRDPMFDYRLPSRGASLLHEGFYPISLQQQTIDRPMLARVSGGVLRAAAPLPRLAFVTVGAQALDNCTEIDGLRVLSTQPGSPGLFTRAVVEISGDQVARARGRTQIRVRDLRGHFGRVPMLGYTDATERSGMRLDVELTENQCWDADDQPQAVVAPVSGRPIPAWNRLALHGNTGLLDLVSHAVVDVDSLMPGSALQVDLANCRVSGGPPDLPGIGQAEVQAYAAGPGRRTRIVRVEVLGGGTGYRAWRDAGGRWTVGVR